jgi:uncharacterized protein (DUF4415 family)
MKSNRKDKQRKRRVSGRKSRAGRVSRLLAIADQEGKGWLENMQELYRPLKKSVTLRLDADVLAWFKRGGRGYQTRINRALRGVMTKERKAGK